MLIFPELEQLYDYALAMGWHLPTVDLLKQPQLNHLYQSLIDDANKQLPSWSKVKRFQLIDANLTVANGLLNSDLEVIRTAVEGIFATDIDALYRDKALQTVKPKPVVIKISPKPLIRSLVIKAKLLWRSLKNYITLPSIIGWKLQNTPNSEELK